MGNATASAAMTKPPVTTSNSNKSKKNIIPVYLIYYHSNIILRWPASFLDNGSHFFVRIFLNNNQTQTKKGLVQLFHLPLFGFFEQTSKSFLMIESTTSLVGGFNPVGKNKISNWESSQNRDEHSKKL